MEVFRDCENEFYPSIENNIKRIREIFNSNLRNRIGSLLSNMFYLINGEIENGEILIFGLLQIWEKTKDKIINKK